MPSHRRSSSHPTAELCRYRRRQSDRPADPCRQDPRMVAANVDRRDGPQWHPDGVNIDLSARPLVRRQPRNYRSMQAL